VIAPIKLSVQPEIEREDAMSGFRAFVLIVIAAIILGYSLDDGRYTRAALHVGGQLWQAVTTEINRAR
jgi:hypothetical protein